MPSRHPLYTSRDWRRTSQQVLARDNWVCRIQKPGVCTYRATTAHHTIGVVTGLDPAFLVAACRPCNSSVGHPEVADPAPRMRTRW